MVDANDRVVDRDRNPFGKRGARCARFDIFVESLKCFARYRRHCDNEINVGGIFLGNIFLFFEFEEFILSELIEYFTRCALDVKYWQIKKDSLDG